MDQKKKLQRLTRMELLELLLEQTYELDHLRQRLEKADEMLADRHIKIENSGDLAHAVLAVNNVMEAAQAAAQQYIDNAKEMMQETEEKCARMLADAEAEVKKMHYDAMLGEELAAEILGEESK